MTSTGTQLTYRRGWRLDSRDHDAVSILDPETAGVVWVDVAEIDPNRYPSIHTYIEEGWQETPSEGWTDFLILSSRGIRSQLPVEAHEFVFKYTDESQVPSQGRVHYYIMGRYQIRVSALSELDAGDTADEASPTLLDVQESFEPASYTSAEYGYSLAHPTDWLQAASESGEDYYAFDPSSTAEVAVDIHPAQGLTSILDYAAGATLTGAETISQGEVASGRRDPSYRIDYSFLPPNGGALRRGALLLTLSGGNIIAVFVGGDEDEWTDLEPLASDILAGVAVESD